MASEWDFYPTSILDADASIWLDLQYRNEEPPRTLTTRYWLRITMHDVDQHGMGSEAEANVLWPVEDAITKAATRCGLTYVGRVRCNRIWELSFYGPPLELDSLASVVAAVDLGGRATALDSELDATWSYYHEFLLPDEERSEWMQNRRTVEVLKEHGDDPTIPRLVDHWAYFPSDAARRAFLDEVIALGFTSEDADSEPYPARISRIEPTTLDSIHATTETLRRIARAHGGTYDGWEAPVEKR
jgi:Regulator of ribonuclease activity B/Family of unknown function (DUF695)